MRNIVVLVDPVKYGKEVYQALQNSNLLALPVLTLPDDVLAELSFCLPGEALPAIFSSDPEKIVMALQPYRGNIKAVIPVTEPGTEIANVIAQSLGLPGNASTNPRRFRDKHIMRKHAQSAGIRVPRFQLLAPEASFEFGRIQAPAIMKPLCSAGSDGVKLVQDVRDVNFHRATYRRDIFGNAGVSWLIEQYIEGREFAVNTVSSGGGHAVIDVWEYCQPSGVTMYDMPYWNVFQLEKGQLRDRIETFAFQVLTAFQFELGFAQIELKMQSKTSELVFIELGARLPGWFPPIWKEDFERDPFQSIDRLYAGELSDLTPYLLPGEKLSGIVIIRNDVGTGVLRAINGLDDVKRLPGVRGVTLCFDQGETVPRTQGLHQVLARIGIQAGARAELEQIANTVRAMVGMELLPLSPCANPAVNQGSMKSRHTDDMNGNGLLEELGISSSISHEENSLQSERAGPINLPSVWHDEAPDRMRPHSMRHDRQSASFQHAGAAAATRLSRAVLEWKTLLGAGNVVEAEDMIASCLKDMSEYAARHVPVIIRPRTSASIAQLIGIARRHGIAVYPYGTGKNWGMGSRKPVRDGCALLDLSLLDAIIEINHEQGYAIIEPGVTQRALANELAGSRWQINVTGSCADTSIIGNALERGVGFTSQRTHDLTGVQIVLGTGQTIRAGSFWSSGTEHLHYRHGVGPDLVSLFCQSNFGVVTEAIIRLVPVAEDRRLFMATCLASQLNGAADLLQACYRDGLFSNAMKFYSPAMSSGYGMKASESGHVYRIYASVAGRPEMVARACGLIHQDCRRSGLFDVIQFANSAELQSHDEPFARIIDGLYKGQPGCIGHATFSPSCDLDKDSDSGWCAVLPVLPFSGRHLAKVSHIADAVASQFGRHIGITFGVLDDRSVESVIATRFNRNQAERASAHQCMAELRKRLGREGYRPYRTNIDFFDPEMLYGSACYIDTLQQLKRCFDPDAVISPGRYIPE